MEEWGQSALLETQCSMNIGAATADGAAPKSGGVQTLVVPDLGDFEDVEVIEVLVSNGDEIRIEIKGAFIHPEIGDLFVDDLKLDRAWDLFKCGYT